MAWAWVWLVSYLLITCTYAKITMEMPLLQVCLFLATIHAITSYPNYSTDSKSSLLPLIRDQGYEATTSVECADKKKSNCPDDNTCCKLTSTYASTDEYGCCSIPNAVCCSNGQHCCPSGYKCDNTNGLCEPRGNAYQKDLDFLQVIAPSDIRYSSVNCPNGSGSCLDNQTCCKLPSSDGYGCCPLPNAVCCNNGHCCPNDYACQDDGTCTDMRKATQFFPVLSSANTACPNGHSNCAVNQTCCLDTSGDYGCCPAVNATCCSDKIHCCPGGTTCDLEGRTCR